MGEAKRRKEILGGDYGKPTDNDKEEILAALKAFKNAEPISIRCDAIAAFMLLTQLQLASRHPGNTGEAADTTKQFALGLQERLIELYPPIADFMEKGWYEIFDVNPQGEPAPKAKFAHLDRDRQEHIVANHLALGIAVGELSKHCAYSFEQLATIISEQANIQVDRLDDLQIAQTIASMDEDYE